jgi:small subunit ribosomal protein S20
MANIKSQIKRNRQNEKRRIQNRVVRGSTRTALYKARLAVETNQENSEEMVKKAIIALDKAAQKGVIHKNNAARKKSRLIKKLAATKKSVTLS